MAEPLRQPFLWTASDVWQILQAYLHLQIKGQIENVWTNNFKLKYQSQLRSRSVLLFSQRNLLGSPFRKPMAEWNRLDKGNFIGKYKRPDRHFTDKTFAKKYCRPVLFNWHENFSYHKFASNMSSIYPTVFTTAYHPKINYDNLSFHMRRSDAIFLYWNKWFWNWRSRN